MKERIIKILEDNEEEFNTIGYYGAPAGWGIKQENYAKIADLIIEIMVDNNTTE